MHPVLRLYEDVLASAEKIELRLPPVPRRPPPPSDRPR